MRYFWCCFALIFILTRGIAVSKHREAVYGDMYYNLFEVAVFGEIKVSAVITLFRTFGIVGIAVILQARVKCFVLQCIRVHYIS